MERRPRYRLLGGLLFGAIVSACASIMGVEAPVLDPDASGADGGSSRVAAPGTHVRL